MFNQKFKSKFETSKILLLFVCFFSLILTCLVLYVWIFFEKEDVAAILGIVISPAITIIGFYMIKARSENMVKIREYLKINKLYVNVDDEQRHLDEIQNCIDEETRHASSAGGEDLG